VILLTVAPKTEKVLSINKGADHAFFKDYPVDPMKVVIPSNDGDWRLAKETEVWLGDGNQ
jgi:hypothetical protein